MEYKVGQWILTKSLAVYHVDFICNCNYCKETGFHEPYVTYYNIYEVDKDVISIHGNVSFEKCIIEVSQDEPTDRIYEILEKYKQNQINNLELLFPRKK